MTAFPSVRTAGRGLLLAIAAASVAACASKKPPPPPMPPGPPPGSSATDSGGADRDRERDGFNSRQVGAAAPGSERDFIVNAGDRVYFELNAHTVSDDGRRVLDAQAAWLQRYPQVRVRIEGNCDERGTREYNLALGGRRAEAVKEYLASRGVSAARITTISYGKERPVDSGDGEDLLAKNRNAHTAITAGALGG